MSRPEHSGLKILHVAFSRFRGGLMRMIETLTAHQSRSHGMQVMSPLAPHLHGHDRGDFWVKWEPTGNADFRSHLQLRDHISVTRPDLTIVHAGSPGEGALATALAAAHSACLLVEHSPGFYPRRAPVRDIAYRWMKHRSHGWYAVSQAGARRIEDLFRLNRLSIGTLHNGVESPQDVPPEQPDRRALFEAGPVVLGVGSPIIPKGFDTFCRIADATSGSLTGFRWVWLGGPSQEALGRVLILPWAKDIGWFLRHSTMLLMPTRAEGLPLTLLEAWACSKPVIASAVGGIPELVTDGLNALLVAPEDLNSWCTAVQGLAASSALRERLGREGQRLWAEDFTAGSMAARYESAIEAALAARRATRGVVNH